MKRLTILAPALLATLLLAGCLGSSGPDEVFLRLDVSREESCPPESEDKGAVLMGVKEFTALPGLNRQAVVVARGAVMRPSTVWYWEGAPASMVTKAMAYRLTCTPGLTLIAPYSPRIRHAAVLSGELLAFEVVRGADSTSFNLDMRLELWGKNSRVLLGARSFAVTTPVKAMTADAVAEAAAEALWQAISQAEPWLLDLAKVHGFQD